MENIMGSQDNQQKSCHCYRCFSDLRFVMFSVLVSKKFLSKGIDGVM
jgi:hypothetical protein